MSQFISGLELSRSFFSDAVRPIIQNTAPGLQYAAALIGSGSEVLGFDDEMSSDHHWGPRVMVFVNDLDQVGIIDAALRKKLPPTFLGYPTNFSEPDPNDNNVQRLVQAEEGSINHRVEIFILRDYIKSYLNFDVDAPIAAADWLTFPEQKLRTLTSENVFHDEIGVRETLGRFAYYPHDVWLYLLASGWNRISQEEHLMGRAGFAGDEIGSALIGSRLVRDIMRLCFLMERVYAPYSKWFGTAFRRLDCASKIKPNLETALRAATWQERQSSLIPAYETIAVMHNELGLTQPLTTQPADFFGRPFKVIEMIGDFASAIKVEIKDPDVRHLAERRLIGSIDQISDNTDILSDSKWRMTLTKLYE